MTEASIGPTPSVATAAAQRAPDIASAADQGSGFLGTLKGILGGVPGKTAPGSRTEGNAGGARSPAEEAAPNAGAARATGSRSAATASVRGAEDAARDTPAGAAKVPAGGGAETEPPTVAQRAAQTTRPSGTPALPSPIAAAVAELLAAGQPLAAKASSAPEGASGEPAPSAADAGKPSEADSGEKTDPKSAPARERADLAGATAAGVIPAGMAKASDRGATAAAGATPPGGQQEAAGVAKTAAHRERARPSPSASPTLPIPTAALPTQGALAASPSEPAGPSRVPPPSGPALPLHHEPAAAAPLGAPARPPAPAIPQAARASLTAQPAAAPSVALTASVASDATASLVPPDPPAGSPPPPSPAAQLAPALFSLAHGKDSETLTIRLEPASLGRVEVAITRAPDAPVSVSITSEQSGTLLLLMRDQPALQQALGRAGVPQGSPITFHLAPAVSATTAPTNPSGQGLVSAGFGAPGGTPSDARSRRKRPHAGRGIGASPSLGPLLHQGIRGSGRWRRAGLDITA